jgi:hypothetical protein
MDNDARFDFALVDKALYLLMRSCFFAGVRRIKLSSSVSQGV